MSWFIVDESQLQITVRWDTEKFNELVKKPVLAEEDIRWLCDNSLIECCAMAKGGTLQFKGHLDPAALHYIYGHCQV